MDPDLRAARLGRVRHCCRRHPAPEDMPTRQSARFLPPMGGEHLAPVAGQPDDPDRGAGCGAPTTVSGVSRRALLSDRLARHYSTGRCATTPAWSEGHCPLASRSSGLSPTVAARIDAPSLSFTPFTNIWSIRLSSSLISFIRSEA